MTELKRTPEGYQMGTTKIIKVPEGWKLEGDPVDLNVDKVDGKHADDLDYKTTAKARAYLNAPQSIPGVAVATKVNLDTENYDIGNSFDTILHRFVAPVAGYYQVNAIIKYINMPTPQEGSARIYKNGALYCSSVVRSVHDAHDPSPNISDVIPLGVGDYLELWARNTNPTAVVLDNTSMTTFMSIHLLSKD